MLPVITFCCEAWKIADARRLRDCSSLPDRGPVRLPLHIVYGFFPLTLLRSEYGRHSNNFFGL